FRNRARTWPCRVPTISPWKCANCRPSFVTISRHASGAVGNCDSTCCVKVTSPHPFCASADGAEAKPPRRVAAASKLIVFLIAVSVVVSGTSRLRARSVERAPHDVALRGIPDKVKRITGDERDGGLVGGIEHRHVRRLDDLDLGHSVTQRAADGLDLDRVAELQILERTKIAVPVAR